MFKKTKSGKKSSKKAYIEMIEENNKLINLEKNYKINDNYIIAILNINQDDINKDIRIINSYEDWKRENKWGDNKNDYIYENEREIKEKCEIKINGKIIPFSYFYKFKKKGKYEIKYIFKTNIVKADYMFTGCQYLLNMNLSNFSSQNIINMSNMFCQCSSLININLSNINTQNIIKISGIFFDCKSLSDINLSNLNNQNLTDMSYSFFGCNSLTNINLSNFNTHNVIDMSYLFDGCKSLTNINLSNFNTQNVTDMSGMFLGCKSLANINLSNFNTQNVIYMVSMFEG